ncbi:Nucleolin 2 [Cardamine amara subsp. amara]|uniref:Nucleolin 2 n=1 Tax=Cardamine amara subsp. amara TaxID=228776 RepID=A0ABD1AW73_CARAN
MKGFEFLDSSDPSGPRRFSRICVEGYDTSLYEYDLELALIKHFSSCGEIIHIYVPRNFEEGILRRYAFIDIAGEGALEKALELSGSYVDVGGWQVFAKESPYQGEYIDPGWAAVSKKHFNSQHMVTVMGYDTSLPVIDLQIGLSKHFSSCGEVTRVTILPNVRRALIYIRGVEGAAEKALELSSGRDVGGCNITVTGVMQPRGPIKNFPTSNRASPMMKALMMKNKMKNQMKDQMTTE